MHIKKRWSWRFRNFPGEIHKITRTFEKLLGNNVMTVNMHVMVQQSYNSRNWV